MEKEGASEGDEQKKQKEKAEKKKPVDQSE